MRLLRLELSGFKSFSDKISVTFVQDGVSIIVGPNGCGKSNIVDAIRWVLGEQSAKHLRGATMEDVIFNGSQTRPPVSMAQVTLYFSNPKNDTLKKYNEFNEISITRKLFRSGESGYQINKTNCRLSDIRELFMDTGIGGKGYSIIEQGRIDQIVTSRPTDRRNIIDEAAGIVKFKTKRNDAERKFGQSRQNLVRVQDIIAELEIQEETLSKQVKEANIFLEARGKHDRLSKCLVAYKWDKLRTKGIQFHEARIGHTNRLEELAVTTAGMDTKKAQLELTLVQKRQGLEDFKEIINAENRKAIQLEGKLEADRSALKNLDEWEQKGGKEAAEISEKIESLADQSENLDFELEGVADENLQTTEQREEIKERLEAQQAVIGQRSAQLETLKKEELELKSSHSGEGEQLEQLKERQQEVAEKQTQNQDKLSTFEKVFQEKKDSITKLKSELEQKEEAKEVAEEKLSSLKSSISNMEEQFGELDETITNLTKEHSQTESRLISIEEFLEGHEDFDQGAKTMLDHFVENPDKARELGFMGTLTDLIQPSLELPEQVKSFVGRHFNLVVFQTANHLPEIEALITEIECPYIELCFVDLAPSERDLTASIEKWIAWEKSSLHLAEQFTHIDGRIALLDSAQWRTPHGLIDHKGAVLTKEKIFCLGHKTSESRGAVLLERRQELVQLQEKLKKLDTQVISLEEQEFAQKERLEEMDNLLENTQSQLVEMELSRVTLAKELSQAIEDLERLQGDKEEMAKELAEADANNQRFSERIQALHDGLASKQDRVGKLSEELESILDQLDEARLQKDMIQAQDQEKEVRLAGLTEKRGSLIQLKARLAEEIQQAEAKLNEINKSNQDTQGQRDLLEANLKTSTETLPLLLERIKQYDLQQREMVNEIEELTQESNNFQSGMANEFKEQSELKDKIRDLDIQLATVAQEAKNLEENLFQEKSIRPEEVLDQEDLTDFAPTKVETELRSLKKIVDNIEGVNLAAKAEYDTLMERLEFLRKESGDLIDAIETLEASIAEIDVESKKRFRATFKAINENFIDLFPKLFGGGSAHLKLTDPDNLLETGVEIIAQPPGKNLQNMTLLSGGEKAMTAIALIFAIFQMKPSPFCLLDEVDAPLDDANNGRFNEHVKAMTANSQFVIITHNKKTMEIGDAMFGVTMEEPGTSKVVSVDFREAAEKFIEEPVG